MTISVRSTGVQQAAPDGRLAEVAEAAGERGEPIQIRVAPQLYKPTTRQYYGWLDLAWTVGVPTVEDAEALKKALGAFFDAVSTGNVSELAETLIAFRQEQG